MNRTINHQTITILVIIFLTINPFIISHSIAQTSETWKEYVDPEGEFSIEYPSTWDLKPLNRFETTDLYMYSPEGLENGYGIIQYYIFSERIGSVLDQYGDQSDFEGYLELVFPSFLDGIRQSVDNYNQVENIDYNTYKIDGNQAASVILSYELKGLDIAGWIVWTLLGSKMFCISIYCFSR